MQERRGWLAPTSVPESSLLRDSQLAPRKFGAFLHAGQTEVSGAAAFPCDLLIDPLSVVQDPQPKLPPFIPDLYFDPPRLGVSKCIAHRLACNPVDFVPDERSEIPGCAFHHAHETRGNSGRCNRQRALLRAC
jgi:hypothetical protein